MTAQGGQPRKIDVHHHVFPPVYVETAKRMNRLAEVLGADPKRIGWTPADSLAAMDAFGIRKAIVSISTPGVWWGDPTAAADLSRGCNDYSATLVREHPNRYGFFAALPLPDVEASIIETGRAFDDLNASGIGLMTNYEGRWPGDPAFAPVFAELDRRCAVVFFHPTVADCCRGLIADVGPSVIEYPLDTVRAVTSLLASGTFMRYPNIRWIFAHGGGAVPMLAGRIARLLRTDAVRSSPKGALFELKRLYFDIAIATSGPAFAALLAFSSIANVLYGTDYPFMPVEDVEDGLQTLGLSTHDRELLESGNAAQLFGLV